MEKIKLLPHNENMLHEVVDKLNTGIRDILYIQGTVLGKSYVFFSLIIYYFRNAKILFVAPNENCFKNLQMYPEFKMIEKNVTFKTNLSFNSMKKVSDAFEQYDLFFIDEAHHIGSEKSGKYLLALRDLVREYDADKWFIGTTATAVRSSDKVDVRTLFSDYVMGHSLFTAIRAGLIPQVEYRMCNKDVIENLENETKKDFFIQYGFDTLETEEIIRCAIEKSPRDKWICFFNKISDISKYRPMIDRLFPDHEIVEIHSKTDLDISVVKNYKKIVILSVSKLLESIHVEGFDAILTFREVASETVVQQMLGRIVHMSSDYEPLFIDCTVSTQYVVDKWAKMQSKIDNGIIITKFEGGGNGNHQHNNNAKDIFKVDPTEMIFYDIFRSYKECNIFYYRGKFYNTKKECVEAYGFTISSIHSYMNNHKVSFTEAMDYYVDKKNMIEYRGKFYNSQKECCEAYDILQAAISRFRSKHKISFNEAMDYFVEKKNMIEYRGKFYSTMKECAEAYGFKRDAVNYYMNSHTVSFTEAMDHYIDKKQCTEH